MGVINIVKQKRSMIRNEVADMGPGRIIFLRDGEDAVYEQL